MDWLGYVAMFIAGYMIAKWRYFIRSTRLGVLLIKASQVIALSVIAKGLEDYYYAKTMRMEKMLQSGESDHNITAYTFLMEEEISYYKKKAIAGVAALHQGNFQQLLEFDDWPSAMKFLEKNKDVVQLFLIKEEYEDDRPY